MIKLFLQIISSAITTFLQTFVQPKPIGLKTDLLQKTLQVQIIKHH